jgi:hypothetical protein
MRPCQTCWDDEAEQGSKQCLRCQQYPGDTDRISQGRLMVKREGIWTWRSLDNGTFTYEPVKGIDYAAAQSQT